MIKSLAPGMSVTIQGTEQAIASRTTLGEASRCEGSINNWDVTRKEMASERCEKIFAIMHGDKTRMFMFSLKKDAIIYIDKSDIANGDIKEFR